MIDIRAYEIHVCNFWPYQKKLLQLGHTPVSIVKKDQGFCLKVLYKCGETDYLTVREREILDGCT